MDVKQKAEKYGESEGDQNRRIRTKEGLRHTMSLSTFGLVISWKLDGKSPTGAVRLDRSSLSSQPKLPVTLHPTPHTKVSPTLEETVISSRRRKYTSIAFTFHSCQRQNEMQAQISSIV